MCSALDLGLVGFSVARLVELVHGGFGYRFWRPLAAAFSLFVIGWAVFSRSASRDGLVPTCPGSDASPTQCTDDYPCIQAAIYSLDVLQLVLDLRQDAF